METYGNKNKSPQLLNDEAFTPKDIVKALEQLGLGDVFKALKSKLNTPFVNIPDDGESFDLRRVVSADAGTVNATLLTFKPPVGQEAIITGYGIYSDAQFAAFTNFIPTLEGRRVFPYHGTPTVIDNSTVLPYRISLGLAPDLSNESLIECALRVKATQTFKWTITNTSAVPQVMGVRFKGYLRPVSEQRNYKIGG